MPEPMTAATLLGDWYPQILICTAAITGIGFYLAGVRRLFKRGDSWPIARTLPWVGGWLLAVFVTSSGMGKYGMVLFSVHMMQHMTLNMLVPILLVLGAPITLAFRALKPSKERGLAGMDHRDPPLPFCSLRIASAHRPRPVHLQSLPDVLHGDFSNGPCDHMRGTC